MGRLRVSCLVFILALLWDDCKTITMQPNKFKRPYSNSNKGHIARFWANQQFWYSSSHKASKVGLNYEYALIRV